jgi:hypothetical protein
MCASSCICSAPNSRIGDVDFPLDIKLYMLAARNAVLSNDCADTALHAGSESFDASLQLSCLNLRPHLADRNILSSLLLVCTLCNHS